MEKPTYLRKVKTVSIAPVGYLSTFKFAERVGCTRENVQKCLKTGRINPNFLCYLERGKKGSTLIDYNHAVIPFLQTKRGKFLPEGYTPGDKKYRPLDEKEWQQIMLSPVQRPGPKTIHDGAAFRKTGRKIKDLYPDDMHESKLVHEHKKIEKIDTELLIAKNQLLPIADVVSTVRMMCVEIKQAWEAFEVKVAPLVLASKDMKEVKEIFLKERKNVMEKIERLMDAYGEDE